MKTIRFLIFTAVLPVFMAAQSKQQRAVSNFSSLKVSSAIQVILTMADSESLYFEAEGEVLPRLKAEVMNGTLVIYADDCIHTSKEVRAYVNAKHLTQIGVSGAAGIRLTNALMAPKLSIESSGAGSMELELNVKKVDAGISGAGRIEIKGLTEVLWLDLSGAANFGARYLKAEEVKVRTTGASHARVTAMGRLKVNASGASKVIYSGEPRDKDIFTSGAATVKAG